MRTNRPIRRIPTVTVRERDAYRMEFESRYPGYINENTKLTEIVRILTGVRLIYGFFNLLMFKMFDLGISQGLLMLFSTLFFYCWYTWMLRSGRLVAVFMLAARGYSIISGGASLLTMAAWLPYPLIFTLVAACVIEFIESVFCIYVLFSAQAAQTVRLNRELRGKLLRVVAPDRLKELAEYQNPYDEEASEGEAFADAESEEEKE